MTSHYVESGHGRAELGGDGRLLRFALKLDAVATGAAGALMLAGGWVLDDLLGAPLAQLLPVGAVLLLYATVVWWIGSRAQISGSAVRVVVAVNLLWVAANISAVVAGWLSLTTPGVALVLAQAVVVALLVELEYRGLRRSRA